MIRAYSPFIPSGVAQLENFDWQIELESHEFHISELDVTLI
jgi:hypothetical protein